MLNQLFFAIFVRLTQVKLLNTKTEYCLLQMTPLELQIQTLPENPGVYQYYDKNDTILYVGKAKNLKKRVASYFNKTQENGKTRVLVKKL